MKINFEFDPQKSARNKGRHGIDFEEAQSLWLKRVIQVRAEVVHGETRYATSARSVILNGQRLSATAEPYAESSRFILPTLAKLHSMSDFRNQRPDRPVPISTREFDRKVEAGEEIDDHPDWGSAETLVPGELSKREEIALLKERVSSLQDVVNDLVARVERFEAQEAAK